MDGKLYYQAIVINTEAGTYKAAELWDGSTAKKRTTQWEAEDDLSSWARSAPRDLPEHIHLGVQEVRSTPMPGHKPVNDYKQGE